jgi:hypothetical protein
MRTTDSDLACEILCNTDFIPNLNDRERAILRELAIKTKDKYNAEKALNYIYDLTQEERYNLNKLAKG